MRGRAAWRRAAQRAERQMDATQIAALGNISDVLAEIDRLARDARHGKYREPTAAQR